MATNFLNTLLQGYAQDALTNHFKVSIGVVNALAQHNATYKNELDMRVLTVSIPPQTVSTYEVTKRGRKFSRASGVTEQSYEFSVTYRLDKNFRTYTMISDWMKVIQSPLTMAMGSDTTLSGPNAIRDTITIEAVDSHGNIRSRWIMQGAFPKEQSSIEFDENSGDPIVITVTFHCMTIIYPNSLGVGGDLLDSAGDAFSNTGMLDSQIQEGSGS